MVVPTRANTAVVVCSRALGHRFFGSKHHSHGFRFSSLKNDNRYAAATARSVVIARKQSFSLSTTDNNKANNEKTINVSIVYGSFTPNEVSFNDAMEIYEVLNGAVVRSCVDGDDDDTATSERTLSVQRPVCGNEFDWNNAVFRDDANVEEQTNNDVLIISAPSMLGLPPRSMSRFCAELLWIAKTNPGCFRNGILHHAVWGIGDIHWHNTYMNVPRYLDRILGTPSSDDDTSDDSKNNNYCGSTRLHARGEKGEPHREDLQCYSAAMWASKMLHFAKWPSSTTSALRTKEVSWDALWETHDCNHHKMARGFTLSDIVRRYGGDVVLGLGSGGINAGKKAATRTTTKNKWIKNIENDDEYKRILDEYTEFGHKRTPRKRVKRRNETTIVKHSSTNT